MDALPPAGRPTIQIPRWIQLVGLPVLALLAWALAATLAHALFLFLTASVIAFLLNPLVRAIWRGRMPRGLAVTVVYLSFAAAMILALVALGTVVVEQVRSASDRVDSYLTDQRGQTGQTDAERDVHRFQGPPVVPVEVEVEEPDRADVTLAP
jgi:predicted PurR-regulated permease PerM